MGCEPTRLSTKGLPPPARAAAWREIIATSYFPLDLDFAARDRFEGALARWRMGKVALSRLASEPLAYRRSRAHLRHGGEEEYLITLPAQAPVRFAQMGREVRLAPGAFVVERGAEPYEFSYDAPNDLFVVKVGLSTLADRVRAPDRFCALAFDAERGVGRLLAELVRATEARAPEMTEAARAVVGDQIVDLLALAVEGDDRAALSAASAVRLAHLGRIEAFLRRSLANPDLDPETIAAACGISKRYLHDLYRETGRTVREHLTELRLAAARRALGSRADARTIGAIAYACGFSDQAHFSRAFKARYGLTPRAARADERAAG